MCCPFRFRSRSTCCRPPFADQRRHRDFDPVHHLPCGQQLRAGRKRCRTFAQRSGTLRRRDQATRNCAYRPAAARVHRALPPAWQQKPTSRRATERGPNVRETAANDGHGGVVELDSSAQHGALNESTPPPMFGKRDPLWLWSHGASNVLAPLLFPACWCSGVAGGRWDCRPRKRFVGWVLQPLDILKPQKPGWGSGA